MTERLTTWVEKDHAIPRPDIRSNGHQKCINKLAYYEDLEEQGGLVILPKMFDLQSFKEEIMRRYCPSFFKLTDVYPKKYGYCKSEFDRCMNCWEEALKGGAE